MYNSLKTNFYSICLDSVFLNKFLSSTSGILDDGSSAALETISVFNRRRISFVKQLVSIRSSLMSYVKSNFFVETPGNIGYAILRNLHVFRFLQFGVNGFNSVSYSKRLVNQLLKRNSLRASYVSKFSSRTQATARQFLPSVDLVSINTKRGTSTSMANTVLYQRKSLLFGGLFKQYVSTSHTCSFYFRMMLSACNFDLGEGRVHFLFKKLIRLYFYHLNMRMLCHGTALVQTNIKRFIIASFWIDNSSLIYALAVRFLTVLTMDHVRFMQIISSTYTAENSNDMRPINFFSFIPAHLGSFVYSGPISFSSFFIFNVLRFFTVALNDKYHFIIQDTTSLLNNTFNFYINNASARNVFSSLNRGDKMLYGTTSGSFKLRKRVRFKKHAMFMASAKFYRTIAHYYKSKLVRSLYLHFTGFRRSFGLVFQFFRNQIRQNAKYHFQPLNVLFKSQPSVGNSFFRLGNASEFSFFYKGLPMHLDALSYSSKFSNYVFVNSYLSKFSKSINDASSNFFYSSVYPVLKRKSLVNRSLFRSSSTVRSAFIRSYSTNFSRFLFTKSLNSTDESSLVLNSMFFSDAVSLYSPTFLSSWGYSTVYSSIIRTRRQYKLYKKLIGPLFTRTQVELFDYTVCAVRSAAYFYFFNTIRSTLSSAIVSRYLASRGVSYSRSLFKIKQFLHQKRFFSSSITVCTPQSGRTSINNSAALRSQGFNKKKKINSVRKKRLKVSTVSSFRSKVYKLVPSSYLSVFRTRMAIFLNTIFSGSSVRYRPVVSHGGCFKRRRFSDRRYWF